MTFAFALPEANAATPNATITGHFFMTISPLLIAI